MTLKIESIVENDKADIEEMISHFWGDATIVVHSDIFHPTELAGLKAKIGTSIVGFLHYLIMGEECEIITLASFEQGQGIGSALLAKIEQIARAKQCHKLILTTTNDNLYALGFYQRRGFYLTELKPGQVDISREIKPTIPLVGENNIPLRDELQLEKMIV